MKSKITQALVERGPTPERGKSVLHADTEMRGFYLIVTPTKRSFYVQSLVNGKQVRTKLGDHPSMDAKQARDLARKTLVEMRGGANPNEERRKAKARGISEEAVMRDVILAAQPTKQFVTVEQLAGMLLYLCSDVGASVNGAILSIDGGWTAA